VTKKKASNANSLGLDKYVYYEKSVQNVGFDVDFIRDQYKHFNGKSPRKLREDFCGTGKLMCSWVKDSKKNEAFGFDLDPEPMKWGKENHLSKLNDEQQSRVSYLERNVLEPSDDKADVICAFNFSYFIFKERETLIKYFKSVRKSLKKNGVFFMDIFGGPDSQIVQEEETEHYSL